LLRAIPPSRLKRPCQGTRCIVAIPPDCSGPFLRCRPGGSKPPPRKVAIPPDCSGPFLREDFVHETEPDTQVAIPPDCSGPFLRELDLAPKKLTNGRNPT